MSDRLSMRGVWKSYRAGVRGCSAVVSVLRGLDLEVRAGEIVGIMSAPAAGKTTLLLCAAGLLRPDRGSVSWLGAPARREPSAPPAGIAYAGDRPFPYGFLTVREALEYAAIVRDLPLTDSAGRVATALERTGLTASFDRRVDTLDAMGAVRLSLAGALLAQPRVLLVDDLGTGCHVENAPEIATLLRAVAADGAAVIVAGRTVSWLAPGARDTPAARVLVLHAGRLEPATPDVAPAAAQRATPAIQHARVAEAWPKAPGPEGRTVRGG